MQLQQGIEVLPDNSDLFHAVSANWLSSPNLRTCEGVQ